MRTRIIASIIFGQVLVACGGGGGGSTTTPPPITEKPSALLKAASANTSAADLFSEAFNRSTTDAALAVGAPLAEAAADSAVDTSSTNFSTTYTQESDVDEYDAVKYDGTHLFIAPSHSMNCCFVVDDIALPAIAEASDAAIAAPVQSSARAIRILATDSTSAGITPVAEIPLPDDLSVEGLYIDTHSLAAITSSAWWGSWGTPLSDVTRWADQYTELRLYSTKDISNPALQHTIQIEGALLTSRKIGDTAYLVTRHTPNIDGITYYPTTSTEEQNNEQILSNTTLIELLPQLRIDNAAQTALQASDCFQIDPEHDLAPAQLGYPSITTVTGINLSSGDVSSSFCYLDYVDGVYFSGTSLYMTQTYGSSSGTDTYIHKFAPSSGEHYKGSTRVAGHLWLQGNNDFRISESGDYLRIVTSEWTNDASDTIDHHLYVIGEKADSTELIVVGELPRDAAPEEIGKPNEDLYGVRFMDDRAFVVTFERTDPLYVIDLSDANAPSISGQLEVPGFSNFLHPIGDDLLLGLGRNAEGHTKLELFNISDIANPISLAAMEPAADLQWDYSPAEWDRHAFTYLSGDTDDRFAIPISGSQWIDSGYLHRERLYLFEVQGKLNPASAGLSNIGFLQVENLPEGQYADGRNRSVIHDDSVFYINGQDVFSALWQSPIFQTGPY